VFDSIAIYLDGKTIKAKIEASGIEKYQKFWCEWKNIGGFGLFREVFKRLGERGA
jgi:hypothetical protein